MSVEINVLNMVVAHRTLSDQMFRNTLMSTSDAVLLFDAGAGQVSQSLNWKSVLNTLTGARKPAIPGRPLHIHSAGPIPCPDR